MQFPVVFFMLILLRSFFVHAENLRIVSLAGAATSKTFVKGQTGLEGPIGFGVFVESLINERSILGVEHVRSVEISQNAASTAISFTGMYFKFFPYTPSSQKYEDVNLQKGTYFIQKNLSSYIGFGFGLAQSSLRDQQGGAQVKGSVGLFSGLKAGVEYPYWKRSGLITEVSYSQTIIGEGTISLFYFLVGGYLFI